MHRAHGTFDIEVRDRVVIHHLYGAWNEVTANNWANQFIHKIEQHQLHKWSTYIDLTEWQLGNPAAMSFIQKIITWGINNGVQYTLINAGTGQLKKQLMLEAMTYQGKNLAKQVPDAEAARTFLESKGYPLAQAL